MRVPTYKRQTKMTAKTGAINFSVQANPGALSAGSNAMAQFGETATKISLNYLETQLKMERSTDINARENKLRENLSNLIIESNTQSFKTTTQANDFFDRRFKAISKTATKGITDRVVASLIGEKVADLKLIASNDFNKISRMKIIDYGKSEALKKESLLINKISISSGVALEEAKNDLYGKNGLYKTMISDGLIDLETAEKRIMGSKSKSARLTVNKELAAAAYGQDYNAANQIAAKLFDNKEYTELKPEARVTLQRQADTLGNRLERQAAKTDIKAAKVADLKIKKTQIKTNRLYNSKLNNNEVVTLQKIESLYGDNLLNDTQYNNIRERIIEGDEIGSDQGTVLEFRNEIYDAQDKFQVDIIIEKYEKNLGKGKPISYQDFISLREFAEDQKAKTPRALETKRLRGLIRENVGTSAGMNYGVNTSVRDNMMSADALDTFDRLINDKDVNGKTRIVREVYEEVVSQVREAKSTQSFLSLNSTSRGFLGDFVFKNKSEADVKTRLNTLKIEILSSNKFTALEKAIEFETIKLFQNDYEIITNK
mgnify:CR=1 FL=1